MCSMVSGSSSFHLEWNNHLGNMQSVLESLYANQSLVDVTVACKDGVLKAHKVILSACSPYFEAVFRETPCKHPVLILKGVNVREMQALLRFMYCGQVDVPEPELSSLVATACEFKVKGFAMDGMPGVDDYRPDSASDHESETESPLDGLQVKDSGNSWKENIQTANHSDMISNDHEEMDVTPVIVESQSLQNEVMSNTEDNNKQGEEGEEEEKKETNVEESAHSPKTSKDISPAKEGSGSTDVNTSTSASATVSTPVSTSNTSSSSAAVASSTSASSRDATPYRRETRYKGQKRVDVGIRPAPGRARSVEKRDPEMRGSLSTSHSVKKLRVTAPPRKSDHSSDIDPGLPSVDQIDKKIIREPAAVDISITRAGSSSIDDNPLPFVKIKAEAESAEEDDEDEEATADMFCIPHLQELPDTDGVDTLAPGDDVDLATKWTGHPQSLSTSGREQRSVVESPAEEGEGDMACPYCFTRCPRFSDLKRHMRLHTEDKPHECEFCSLAFARASHLARHRRTHTGERPFRCPAPSCERTFSRQDKLKLHTQRAHPGLPCDLVQSGTYMRIRGRRRIRDKNLPLGLRLGMDPTPTTNSSTASSQSGVSSRPAVISLPFGDTSYLTSLSLGQQRYSDLTISPVTTPRSSTSAGTVSGVGAEELLKSVRQLGECTIQTLPSKILAE